MYKYVYDITRYGELQTTTTSVNHLTGKKEIMAFYNREVTVEDKQRIIAGFEKGTIFDTFDYIKDNLINRDPKLPNCTYKELMGDCQFYEGLEEIGDNTFLISLGS